MLGIVEVKKKQYFVEKKDMVLSVDRIRQEKDTVYGDIKVLYYKDDGGKMFIGTPYVEGAVVKAKVIEDFRDQTVRVRRYRPKSGIRKVKGHRQHRTALRIEDISIT